MQCLSKLLLSSQVGLTPEQPSIFLGTGMVWGQEVSYFVRKTTWIGVSHSWIGLNTQICYPHFTSTNTAIKSWVWSCQIFPYPSTAHFSSSLHRKLLAQQSQQHQPKLSTKWAKSQNATSLWVPLRRCHDSLNNNELSTVDQKVTQNHFSYFLEVHRMATSQIKSAL